MWKTLSDYRIQKPQEHFHKKKGGGGVVEMGRVHIDVIWILHIEGI